MTLIMCSLILGRKLSLLVVWQKFSCYEFPSSFFFKAESFILDSTFLSECRTYIKGIIPVGAFAPIVFETNSINYRISTTRSEIEKD